MATMHAELVIARLRAQVRALQGMLNYLESRDLVGYDDYVYLRSRLQEVVKSLREAQRLAPGKTAIGFPPAHWLN